MQSDKINTLTSAASVPIWAWFLAKALAGKDVKKLLSKIGTGGAAAATDVPKKEKEEEREESNDDMARKSTRLDMMLASLHILGFGLFD